MKEVVVAEAEWISSLDACHTGGRKFLGFSLHLIRIATLYPLIPTAASVLLSRGSLRQGLQPDSAAHPYYLLNTFRLAPGQPC